MMDQKQIALKLVLDQIGEAHSIDSVDDRLRLQKAIYLSQIVGLNLGYHYSWYVKGPYSPSLTQDYYRLNEALAAGDASYTHRVLNPNLAALAPRIRDVLALPDDFQVPAHRWYEALASVHFLLRTSGYTLEQAKGYLEKVKPHLNGYFERAVNHLASLGLVRVG